jgi:two-component system chemotaxis response regulator CheB
VAKTKVLIVDDSALMRKLLTNLLSSDPEIEVVGTAMDAFAARDKIKLLKPDVITLDIEMPKMDGITFLSNLMRLHPMPVVMISTLTQQGAELTMRALDLGAVDFVSKPKVDLNHSLDDYAGEITHKVKTAARASVKQLVRNKQNPDVQSSIPKKKSGGDIGFEATDQVIAIGASTGGTEAIKEVLMKIKPNTPGIVITQHIPPVFSKSFADRMDQCCEISVCEASDGQQILPGHAYIAPGDKHMEVVRDGARYRCRLLDTAPVNRHKPSVDVLFDSVAENVGRNAVGVILTGMGKDGAVGLKRMREAGAQTIAQDEKTSVVWGMPQAAIDVGGADKVLPLQNIAANVTEIARPRV